MFLGPMPQIYSSCVVFSASILKDFKLLIFDISCSTFKNDNLFQGIKNLKRQFSHDKVMQFLLNLLLRLSSSVNELLKHEKQNEDQYFSITNLYFIIIKLQGTICFVYIMQASFSLIFLIWLKGSQVHT